jgi:threonyl-tRNA synthetase
LNSTQKLWFTKPGDGAFYGPKIDVMIQDQMGKKHQTATIQLDFQLPSRFQLRYQNEQGDLVTPVLIHRAILGSIERMLAMLTEHYKGKWPFWLSPRHALIATTTSECSKYALEIQALLKDYYVDVDDSDATLAKKIQRIHGLGYNYVFVVGKREVENRNITVRKDSKVIGTFTIEQVQTMFHKLKNPQ